MTFVDTTLQQTAHGIIDSFLSQYGLNALGDQAWTMYLNGQSTDQIFLNLQDTTEWQQRFPAMKALAQQGHAISASDYVNYEQAYAQTLQAAGLPADFYSSKDDIAKALTNNVSISELGARVDLAKTAAYQAPPEVLAALHDFYGVTLRATSVMGDLTAFYLDPQKALPAIQQQFVAAQDAGAAARTGFGAIDQTQAERLAQMGVTEAQAQQGFSSLASLQPLFDPLVGQPGEKITNDQAIGAQFGGNVDAQNAIKKVQAERTAPFQGGGSFARGQSGTSGLGKAQ